MGLHVPLRALLWLGGDFGRARWQLGHPPEAPNVYEAADL